MATRARTSASLAEYRRKRDFTKTREPSGDAPARRSRAARFVVQKHAASHLHFDFRLEIGGTMKSWAVPKGPSLDPAVKRLAMEVEDHPVSYNTFEGTIPSGQYGGGTVMLWDRGHFAGAAGEDDAALARAHEDGRLDIVMDGERLKGGFTLVRTRGRGGKPQWLLMKRSDAYAAAGSDIVADETTSIATGRSMEEIAGGGKSAGGGRREAGRGSAKQASSNARPTKPSRAKAGAVAGGPPPKTISRASAKSASPSARAPKPSAANRAAPATLEPMYASIGTAVPEGDGWTFEPKYDGIRVLGFATADAVRLVTRNGKDKAAQFPEVSDALRALAVRARRPVVLDGEIVALVDGAPARFQALQGRMHVKDAGAVAGHAEGTPASLVAFDLLVDGDDVLLAEPWTRRRARLERLLRTPLKGRLAPRLLLGETETGDGAALVARARERGWEGVIAKQVGAPYSPGRRAAHWLKLKVEHRQEFVVGGWTEPRNTRQYLGALLLGHYDENGQLVYVGHAGGGFTRDGLAAMARRLAPLARKTSPFATPVPTNEAAHWVRPEVVVEVKFIEWTSDGRLRQPIVLGVRDDKDAREVTREGESVQSAGKGAKPAGKTAAAESSATTKPATKKRTAPATPRVAGARATTAEKLARIEESGGDGTVTFGRGLALDVSNLGKVFFPEDGYTKGDVMRYYATVAPQINAVVADRPLVLRRFPNGIEGKAFYQHDVPDAPPGVRTSAVDVDGDGVFKRFLVGGDLATILYGVQLGAVSVDPFHGRVGAIGDADYTIIDLDPGPKAPFARVVEVATWVKAELDALGLRGALKTSGSTGLHIVLPLPRGTSAESALLLAQLVATRVAAAHPREATVERAVKARKADAVYVDYLQNIPGKTVAAAYAVRARPGATVSTPLTWKELTPKLDPRAFTIETVPPRIAKVGDLWAEAMRKPNTTKALAAVGRK
jgi:bifunctional non-homologous end joining protein LigD